MQNFTAEVRVPGLSLGVFIYFSCRIQGAHILRVRRHYKKCADTGQMHVGNLKETPIFSKILLRAPGPATDFCRVDQGSATGLDWTCRAQDRSSFVVEMERLLLHFGQAETHHVEARFGAQALMFMRIQDHDFHGFSDFFRLIFSNFKIQCGETW